MSEITNFIKKIMQDDLDNGNVKKIITRFPPEPNAYLHIGHARAIYTNFLLAQSFGGHTFLRFDDTNPAKEDEKYIKAIVDDLKWLGCKPKKVYFGSDYFEDAFNKALILINKGLAYVDDQTKEQIATNRGTFETPGVDSPFRNRTIKQNMDMFLKMRDGKYKEGQKVLRAKIDMSNPNINLRDPILYRILKMEHHRQKNNWCIYPMYDYAHPLQDAKEGITHSLCSLEFDNHRPLYDWVVEQTQCAHVPHQYEFGRLNIDGMIMSKRYLKELVDKKVVSDYDDPRMPTLVGLKRRGFTPSAIKSFILDTGLSRANCSTDYKMLEHFLREDLKLTTQRKMAILKPLKVVITNYDEDKIEYLEAHNNSEVEELGTREIAFGRNLYIEQDDFCEVKPNNKYKRLSLGDEVRLMNAYFIKCNEVKKDKKGNIIEIHCTYDVATKSGSGFNERKPNGTIHFVEQTTALKAEFHMFDSLINEEAPKDTPLLKRINKNSTTILKGFVEASLADTKKLDHFQFVRNGYYTTDKLSKKRNLIFNCTCELKSSK
ncbi:MAG: glutamine--tRNA ligase/YqeY domain fusion protein [bacterium]